MKKKTDGAQLEFDRAKLQNKRFTISRLVTAKLNSLSAHMEKLTHADVVWLSRVEDFFHNNEYLTERQTAVVDTILDKYRIELTN